MAEHMVVVRGVVYRPRDRVLLDVGWSVCSLMAQDQRDRR